MDCANILDVTQGLKFIALMGNPNVGKSCLFGKLTGKYVNVSNFPGTTVEISKAKITISDHEYVIMDAPGANSLIPFSEEEAIARNILLQPHLDSCIVVCDSKNLSRGLSLLAQIAEYGVKCVLALNMWDELAQRGMRIRTGTLSSRLGITVCATVAVDSRGINVLKDSIQYAQIPQTNLKYPKNIESAIENICIELNTKLNSNNSNTSPEIKSRLLTATRGTAIALLSKDKFILNQLDSIADQDMLDRIKPIVDDCSLALVGNTTTVIEECRSLWAQTIADEVLQTDTPNKKIQTHSFSSFLTHPFIGIIPALVVLWVMYLFVGKFAASTVVGFIETVIFPEYIIPPIDSVLKPILGSTIFYDLLLGEYGLISMGLSYAFAIILPIVTAFFLFFGFLEDSGYLPRLAVLLNNLCKKIGLNGKSIVPMVLGLGCDTMAVITTRVLDTKRERFIVSALLTMAIPCSAKLGVLLAMAGGFSNESFWVSSIRASIWVASIIFTILLVGLVASKLTKGASSELILDVPPMRIPSIKNIWLKTFSRLKWYTGEAVPLFLIGTFVLFIIATIGLLTILRDISSPVVMTVLSLPTEATDAIIMGFFRRDYGAAGFTTMFNNGSLSGSQLLTSMVLITFLVPCIAQVLVLKKETSAKIAFGLVSAAIVYALILAGIINNISKLIGV
ncbi:MAG: ferrous iron transport protein B [Planctomycetes bacterium]|nr:ferrous iron transport protein B [Planctomycetota bacterium]